MIKLFFIFSILISCAYMREKDPHPFAIESSSPTAELFAAKDDDFFMFLNKSVKAIVEGPYVQIQSIYTYKNIRDHLSAARFEFPLIETDISHKVEIRYQDITRVIFDEVNSPKKEYNQTNSFTNERFSYKEIQAGNIRAQDTVEVTFTVMRPLEVKLNQFYELKIRPYHMPRFTSFLVYFPCFEGNYNIQVELRSKEPFKTLANPTHRSKPELSNHRGVYKAFYNVTHTVTFQNFNYFSHDFKIYFASSDFNAPQKIMATHSSNPHDHAFMLSLIPNMKYFSPWDWERKQNLSNPDNFSQLVKAVRKSEIRSFPKEYLFVIDRSDSMKGESLENLKAILKKLIGSLSESFSFYSILSFGNSSQLHWKDPEYKRHEDTREVMKWVDTLQADMGEKDLLGALKFAFEKYGWIQSPKNVIILTDGEVPNLEEVIQHVKTNSNSQKICAIGVEGDGDPIEKIAEAGGCQTEVVHWSKDFDRKALNVIDATLKPPEFNLAYEVLCENEQNETVHREEGGLDGIAKDQVFKKWITLNKIPNLKSCKANIFYYSQNRCSSFSYEEIEIFRSEKVELTDIWHKVADHAKLHNEEESKRILMVNNEEPGQHHRSRYETNQEQFNNLQCRDPIKSILLSAVPLSRPFFESEYDYDDFASKHEEKHEEENFPSKDESFFSFEVTCFACFFVLLYVAAVKIIFK